MTCIGQVLKLIFDLSVMSKLKQSKKIHQTVRPNDVTYSDCSTKKNIHFNSSFSFHHNTDVVPPHINVEYDNNIYIVTFFIHKKGIHC